MTTTTVLDREMYTETEAARLLELPTETLHYWLEGGKQRGKLHKPVIREKRKGTRIVTWAEFVEAALLRQYRREHDVPMGELRLFIENLRDQLQVPYPLATARPFVSGKQLVQEAQEAVGLRSELALVAYASGQLMLTPAADEFYRRVRWEGDIAAGWRPAADPRSLVVIDPDVRFGRPSVSGISTEILREQSESGSTEGELADLYGIDIKEVRSALSYELAAAAA